MFKFKKKGVILFIVLGMVLMVTILTMVILEVITSQSRLTLNQLTRIQAYYSVLAGMNLALERLTAGEAGDPLGWTMSGTYTLCRDVGACNIYDPDIPWTVRMTVYGNNTSIDGVGRRIEITTTYTTP